MPGKNQPCAPWTTLSEVDKQSPLASGGALQQRSMLIADVGARHDDRAAQRLEPARSAWAPSESSKGGSSSTGPVTASGSATAGPSRANWASAASRSIGYMMTARIAWRFGDRLDGLRLACRGLALAPGAVLKRVARAGLNRLKTRPARLL